MNILYVGNLSPQGTCYERLYALKNLGHNVIGIDTITPAGKESLVKFNYFSSDTPVTLKTHFLALVERIFYKVNCPIDIVRVNFKILNIIKKNKFDIIWLDKPGIINPNTFKLIKRNNPKIIIVAYNPDYILYRNNLTKAHLKSLFFFDTYFTTNERSISILKSMGVRNVVLAYKSFSSRLHKPIVLTNPEQIKWGYDVSFCGTCTYRRLDFLSFLARNNIRIKVWSGNWPYSRKINDNLIIEHKSLYREEYSKVICSSKININFLRYTSFDIQNNRSFEIPACGGFMLSERSRLLMKMFKEGQEAEFFSTKQEMIAKIKHYLDYPDKRKNIAEAGKKRCISGGYDHESRLKEMLKTVLYKKDIHYKIVMNAKKVAEKNTVESNIRNIIEKSKENYKN